MKKNIFNLGKKIMIRLPILPIDYYYSLIDNSEKDDKTLIDKLPLKYQLLFREGILTTSKNLYDSLLLMENDGNIKNLDNFYNSIYKYFIRATTRCTPFGGMAGVTFYDVVNDNCCTNNLKLKSEAPIRHLRVDWEWLIGFIKNIERDNINKLSYKMNEAFIVNQGKGILLNYTINKSNESADINYTKALDIIKNLTKDYVDFKTIFNTLKTAYPTEKDDIILGYLGNLIKHDYLISILRPPITIENHLDYVIDVLKKYGIDYLVHDICEIKKKIEEYNTAQFDHIMIYSEIMCLMEKLYHSDNYLQLDIEFIFDVLNIDSGLENQLNDLLNMMIIFSNNISHDNRLKKFKLKFLEKYGSYRFVRLIDVIDKDTGIGLPKIDDESDYKCSNKVSDYFNAKYSFALKNNLSEILITDDEIKHLSLKDVDVLAMPDSIDINLRMGKDNDNYIYELGAVMGSEGAGRGFGRFSRLMHDADNFFEDIVKREIDLYNNDNQEEYVSCEITFLPKKSRLLNVCNDINGSEYEIALSVGNSKESYHQISLDDIFIAIHDNDQFVLKSKRLQKRIYITKYNMLNSVLCPPIVSFLTEIPFDNKIPWYITPWNILFSNYIYVPQIRYKNFILQAERWKVNKNILKLNSDDVFEKFYEKFCDYRVNYKVKNYVYCQSHSDNKLLLNLNNLRCLKILYNEICKKILDINLEAENLKAPINFNDHQYCAELFVPMIKNSKHLPNISRNTYIVEDNIESHTIRYKRPFDEWLYFKFYGISKYINEFIGIEIKNFMNQLLLDKKIDKYFFIRYIDPEDHIRLRIHNTGMKLFELYSTLDQWLQKLIENFYISRFNIDFYDREIERYGGVSLIDHAEDAFFYDSNVCCELIKAKLQKRLTVSNEILGLICIMNYLSAFDLTIEECINFFKSQKSSSLYKNEFKERREEYIDIVIDFFNDISKNNDIINYLNNDREKLIYYKNKIDMIYPNKNVRFQILDSLIHMSTNRLFGIDRKFELKLRCIAGYTMYAVYSRNKHYKILN